MDQPDKCIDIEVRLEHWKKLAEKHLQDGRRPGVYINITPDEALALNNYIKSLQKQ